jgi:hypothetical protein
MRAGLELHWNAAQSGFATAKDFAIAAPLWGAFSVSPRKHMDVVYNSFSEVCYDRRAFPVAPFALAVDGNGKRFSK